MRKFRRQAFEGFRFLQQTKCGLKWKGIRKEIAYHKTYSDTSVKWTRRQIIDNNFFHIKNQTTERQELKKER